MCTNCVPLVADLFLFCYEKHFMMPLSEDNKSDVIEDSKRLRQGYIYHKIRKAFSKLYRRHFDIVSKYDVGFKIVLLQDRFLKHEFYGNFVY